MKATITNLTDLISPPELAITHKDETLIFNVGSFMRKSFVKFDVFQEINNFWSELSLSKQDDLFDKFKNVKQAFDNSWDNNQLSVALNNATIALMDAYDIDEVEHWVTYNSSIIMPAGQATEYVEDIDKRGNREKTYIRSDYRKLTVMALMLRNMIPIWGEYISRTRHESGTVFKEYYAFQLLNGSKIMECEAMYKLRTYIDQIVGPDSGNINTIMGGISSEDFPVWMLSLVTVRRLCIGDLRGVEQQSNLVTFIWAFITQKVASPENNTATAIKNKAVTNTGGEAESKLSSLERFKLTQNISIGEISEINHAVSDYKAIAYKLAPNMTDELFNECIATAYSLNNKRLLDPQMTIARWVMSPVISPRGLMYLPKETIVNILGVCQAVLIAREHFYLALMVTSHANFNENEISLSGVDSRARIPKELADELAYFYPYAKQSGNRKTQIKTTNMAVQSIDILVNDLASVDWVMTALPKHIALYFGKNQTKLIPITHEIKIDIAKLIVEIAKSKKPKEIVNV